jgi:hypothetical protein
MAGSRGYYSLIQYCPDQSRLEVANVGVMLFCPELHFLGTRMARGNDRARRIFEVSGDSLTRIEAAKQAIADRVEVESRNLPTFKEIEQFILSRGNDIIFTQLRPIKVYQPEEDLKRLYRELVGGREHSSRRHDPSWLAELDKAFAKDSIKNKIQRGLRIQLPVTEQQITIPYAFQNGKLNLIKPQQFSAERKETIAKASTLAFEGSLLHKHNEDGIPRELIVVSVFRDPADSLVTIVSQLLRDYDVRHIPFANIDKLTQEIERSAH